MSIKRRNQEIDTIRAEALADELADKAYGEQTSKTSESLTRTSITLPRSLHEKLEDMALKNKRNNSELRTVTSIIREAIHYYLKSTP